MTKDAKTGSTQAIQYAALPYRFNGEADLEFLLVTSRGTRRWIIPKGWPKRGLAPHQTAMQEAFEEAGLAGAISTRPIGSYRYEKIFSNRDPAVCRVQVFAMQVSSQHWTWPECRDRRTEWYSPEGAAHAVTEAPLRRIIRRFASNVRKSRDCSGKHPISAGSPARSVRR